MSRSFWWIMVFAGLLVCRSALCVGNGDATMPGVSQQEHLLLKKHVGDLPVNVQVAVAIVVDDQIRCFGAIRSADGLRLIDNRHGVFEIGSITKVFTATLLARCVIAGKLGLDDAVQSRLPFQLNESGKDGVPVTLKHLASHTSGMCHQPPWIGFLSWVRGHSDDPFRDYDMKKYRAFLADDMALEFVPGTRYAYSNMGMSLVGLVLELNTGRSYEELLQAHIFKPLNMPRSTTDFNRIEKDLVIGIVEEGTPSPSWNMNALTPAGGIKTCAEDFARFAIAQFNPDPAMTLTREPVFTISENYYVGLGWHIVDRKNGERWLNHGGGMGGYTAIVNLNPKRKCGVIVLSNLGNAHEQAGQVDWLGIELLKAVEEQQIAKENPVTQTVN